MQWLLSSRATLYPVSYTPLHIFHNYPDWTRFTLYINQLNSHQNNCPHTIKHECEPYFMYYVCDSQRFVEQSEGYFPLHKSTAALSQWPWKVIWITMTNRIRSAESGNHWVDLFSNWIIQGTSSYFHGKHSIFSILNPNGIKRDWSYTNKQFPYIFHCKHTH